MIIKVTNANFKEVISHNKKILIDFWAPWCSPCRMLGQIIDSLGDEYIIGKINVDEQMELSSLFNVESIPMLLMFKDGKITKKINGFVPVDVIYDVYNN